MWEDRLIMKKGSLFIETHNLATCTESRVYGKHSFLTDRRCEKKLAKILAEYPY